MRVHELHAPVKVVQRSKGRSAVAAAAYRAGERLEDRRIGLVHDYTKKQGVQETALLLPGNAPDYAHDRAALWNAAEAAEKHPRAQTARDLTVGFPSEFSQVQRKEAGLRIGEWLVARYGVAVDIAWHEPSKKGDERNLHAHLLFTTRRWDENGEWAKTKDRALDEIKGRDGKPARGPEEIRAIRLGVSDVLNSIAARDRLEVYVEHLSYEQRGIDQESTQHMGPMATKMEREGLPTDIGDKNRDIKARNEERARLRNENKVIDIEIAREKLKARQQEAQKHGGGGEPGQEPDLYAAFYRETQERRTSLLRDLDHEHGDSEKRLQQESARLVSSLDRKGLFTNLTKLWREVTGRAKAEREQLARVKRALEEIQRKRQAAHEEFEKDRQERLEALKAEQHRLGRVRQAAAQEFLQDPLPRAVNAPAIDARSVSAGQSGVEAAKEERKRDVLRRMGAIQRAQRSSPEAVGDFDQAVSPAPAPEKATPTPADRKDVLLDRMNRKRERGPGREP